MDLISIVVPIYNVEQYLNQCVLSIIRQTYDNLEIILVDDGSSDKCPQLCDQWADKDGRIKVVHKTNGGLSDARNAGLKVVSGDYIAFVDSDDWIHESFIQKLYEEIIDSEVDICECAVSYVNNEGVIIGNRSCKYSEIIYPRLDAIKALIKEDGIYQTVWNKLYKKKLIEDIYFEVGKYHEDDFWTYQIFDRINTIKVVNKPLYYYRQRSNSIMGEGYQRKRLDSLEARIKRMDYFQKDPELAAFSRSMIQFDLLYHLQNILQILDGDERDKASRYVLTQLSALKEIDDHVAGISKKYRVWFFFFRRNPIAVARIRNFLKIGL